MPIIAGKVIAGTLAAATAFGSGVGGYVMSDDLSQTAQIAAEYIEIRMDRHTQEIGREALSKALGTQYSNQGGNPVETTP
ncbi:hypothetical protein QWY97_07905 [Vibrio cortegadensis]|uniref:hypothetical protein n=1 Tax=Vibrio cortegadensis TaxID=1328770 RepID=UPI0021C3EDD7|nr:hypothetical protein [Vibrio cortegadensis]MDN3697277.1 hypothetical protein [Vibrio cortegadensis]